MEPVLQVKNLNISLKDSRDTIKAVENVSFSVEKGRVLGIIGESGSGKSISCMAVLGLLPSETWEYSAEILLNGRNLPFRDNKSMREYRGTDIALIMQNPMCAFNPVMTIKTHFEETLMAHKKWNKKQIKDAAIEMLAQMRIKNPEVVYNSYPFQCSGGMLQRIMIALAIIMEPAVLIADEPTTALDLTVQFEIIKLINEMRRKHNTSVVIVSHDLNVISNIADEIAVMYGGFIVEKAPTEEILKNPLHPYTVGLFCSRPVYSKDRLPEMPGQPLSLKQRHSACMFSDRCLLKGRGCSDFDMAVHHISDNHFVRCCAKEMKKTSA